MLHSPRRWFSIAAAVGVLTILPMPAALASGQSGPHIAAHPDNAMVNQHITLHGTGFGPHERISLQECSAAQWIVPQQACTTQNALEVRTDRRGAFSTSFLVQLCPVRSSNSGPVTARRCYIGEPTPNGVDTVVLTGAVKVVVTYP